MCPLRVRELLASGPPSGDGSRLRAGRPRPQGRACLPPAAVAAAPPCLCVDQVQRCGSKVVVLALAGMGGSPCECLSHATYPDEEAQRTQRAGDSFPVGV